jgi:hypothetical protein
LLDKKSRAGIQIEKPAHLAVGLIGSHKAANTNQKPTELIPLNELKSRSLP